MVLTFKDILIAVSLSMEKLKSAVLGKNNNNINDVQHMDGELLNFYAIYKFIITVLSAFLHTGKIEVILLEY